MLLSLRRVVVMAFASLPFLVPPGLAGEADVVGVKVQKSAPGVYSFAVTVRHGDEGWAHYADAWEVVGPRGKVLGTRVLVHPHDHKPFTRSLSGAKVPTGVDSVRLRACDKVHGFGGAEVVVKLPG